MNKELRPLKGGFQTPLTEEGLHFLQAALASVANQYTDDLGDESPKKVVDSLHGLIVFEYEDDQQEPIEWEKVKDEYGYKAVAAYPFGETEIRVTVVLTKRDELRVDIRPWGTYSNGR